MRRLTLHFMSPQYVCRISQLCITEESVSVLEQKCLVEVRISVCMETELNLWHTVCCRNTLQCSKPVLDACKDCTMFPCSQDHTSVLKSPVSGFSVLFLAHSFFSLNNFKFNLKVPVHYNVISVHFTWTNKQDPMSLMRWWGEEKTPFNSEETSGRNRLRDNCLPTTSWDAIQVLDRHNNNTRWMGPSKRSLVHHIVQATPEMWPKQTDVCLPIKLHIFSPHVCPFSCLQPKPLSNTDQWFCLQP